MLVKRLIIPTITYNEIIPYYVFHVFAVWKEGYIFPVILDYNCLQ